MLAWLWLCLGGEDTEWATMASDTQGTEPPVPGTAVLVVAVTSRSHVRAGNAKRGLVGLWELEPGGTGGARAPPVWDCPAGGEWHPLAGPLPVPASHAGRMRQLVPMGPVAGGMHPAGRCRGVLDLWVVALGFPQCRHP